MKTLKSSLQVERKIFIDPSPLSLNRMTEEHMANQYGGAIFVIVIVACGGRLGAATVITVGYAIATIAD